MSAPERASTPMLIAAAEVLAARGEGHDSLRARLAHACLDRCGAPGARLLRLAGSATGRALLRLAEFAMLPGIAAHYAWRKRRIWRWVEGEVAAGARQLLVLGAGFDALGPRMAIRHPSLRVLEIDRPGTIAVRAPALRACGVCTPRLTLHAADLAAEGLSGALERVGPAGFSRDARTIVVAEGLLMYLPLTAVARLCRDLQIHLRAPAGIVASAMECDARSSPGFRRQRRWVDGWLARRGEPFAWGAARADLPEVLAPAGIVAHQFADPRDPHEPDPCPGEWLFRGTLLG